MEYKVREFDGSAMLAFEAAERGWGTILGSKTGIRSGINLPRGMLVERWIEPGSSKRLAASLAMGQKLSAWCEEGLVYPNAEQYGQYKVEKKSLELLEAFFTWGENQYHDMVDKLGCNGDNIIVSGNPRLDVHRADLRALFSAKHEQIRAKFSPLILVNTQFPFFNGFYSFETIQRKWRKSGQLRTAADEAKMQDLISYQGALFAEFIELTETLSRQFPAYTIVVRPHPSERLDSWRSKAAMLPNVKVIQEGNVAEWLLASEICIHTNCTTGVEAFLLDKPAISYRPVCDPRFDLFLPNALSLQAFSVDELLEIIHAFLRGEQTSTDAEMHTRAEIARHFIANFEGKRACERILDALDLVDLSEEPLSFPHGLLDSFEAVMRNQVKIFKGVLGGAETATRKRHITEKLDGTDRAHLIERLMGAQNVTGRFKDVQVVELERNLLCIYSQSAAQ
jgi:surface carbohydrate biosynthesis protein